MWHCGYFAENHIQIYIQQDATLHGLFISGKLLYVFRVVPPPIIRSTQLHLQHLVLVKPLLLPAAIAAGSSTGLTSTRCCKFSCVCS